MGNKGYVQITSSSNRLLARWENIPQASAIFIYKARICCKGNRMSVIKEIHVKHRKYRMLCMKDNSGSDENSILAVLAIDAKFTTNG